MTKPTFWCKCVEYGRLHCHFHLSDPKEDIIPSLPSEAFTLKMSSRLCFRNANVSIRYSRRYLVMNLTNERCLIAHEGLKSFVQHLRALGRNVVDLLEPHLRC